MPPSPNLYRSSVTRLLSTTRSTRLLSPRRSSLVSPSHTNTSSTIAVPHRFSSTMPRLNINNINQNVVKAQYAVRGELAVKSEKFRAQIAAGDKSLPFAQVISANIGNPQQLDQKPITFFRQVTSLLENPLLLEHEDVLLNQLGYKSDVIARAKWLLNHVQSVGAYSASAGVPAIKQSIANFLESKFRTDFFILNLFHLIHPKIFPFTSSVVSSMLARCISGAPYDPNFPLFHSMSVGNIHDRSPVLFHSPKKQKPLAFS
jgi:hypothetical protein